MYIWQPFEAKIIDTWRPNSETPGQACSSNTRPDRPNSRTSCRSTCTAAPPAVDKVSGQVSAQASCSSPPTGASGKPGGTFDWQPDFRLIFYTLTTSNGFSVEFNHLSLVGVFSTRPPSTPSRLTTCKADDLWCG